MDRVTLYTDGAARGNPGPAAIGVVITDPTGKELEAFGEAIGVATNNEAEYRALLRGLERAAKLGAAGVEVRCDSELMVQQLSSVYRVRAANLKPLHAAAQRALAHFASTSIRHIPRARNGRADALANAALDAAGRPNRREHKDDGLF
ncbi:MAG: ribonuclease HI family protein [Chloroflexi bacterium]|nr:ribonuclease HI family protein [Chloroflexota bacterium]